MSREHGPGTADSALHLGGCLVHEYDHLPQVFDFSFEKKYFDMHPVDLEFFQSVRFLIGENFLSASVLFSSPQSFF